MIDYQRLKPDIVACQLELTNVCSLANCAECAYPVQTRKKGFIDLQAAKQIIKDCVDTFGPISFNLNGLGEPLCYPFLPEIIEFIGNYSPKSRIEIFTSLVLQDLKQIQKVIKSLLTISNQVLFATSFHLYNKSGKKFGQMTSFYRFWEFYDTLGHLDRIDFHAAMNITKFHSKSDRDLFIHSFSFLLGQSKVHLVEKLDPWLETVREYAIDTSDVMGPAVCDYPFRVLHITWDKTVLICCTDDIAGLLPIGNIDSDKLDKIWNSDIINKIRERHNNLDVKDLVPCNICGRTKGYINR